MKTTKGTEVFDMTRFQQEITGELGQWWKDHAEKEVERAVREADELAIVDSNGAIKWKSNGSYLMDDFCEMLEYAGYQFSRKATAKARNIQVKKCLREYEMNYTGPNAEELAEMRAAFGAGETIVDVITGDVITL